LVALFGHIFVDKAPFFDLLGASEWILALFGQKLSVQGLSFAPAWHRKDREKERFLRRRRCPAPESLVNQAKELSERVSRTELYMQAPDAQAQASRYFKEP
jgi:hypothetical protein